MEHITDNNIHDLVRRYLENPTSFPVPISNWNVSNVTNMFGLFEDATTFNEPLNGWDVSNVTDMTSMFKNAPVFNQPLDSWDVSNVMYMTDMFAGATNFNQPLDSWDVSNVEFMSNMFAGAENFNQPLNSWDVSNVASMKHMFLNASSFNQPLNSWIIDEANNTSEMFLNSPMEEHTGLWPPGVAVDEDDDSDLANDVYDNLQKVPLKKSKISVQPNDEGHDLIMLEDVKVTDYLSQDPGNIVFYFGKNVALLSDKTTLKKRLNGNTLKYACINTGSMAEHNIIKDTPYLHLNGVGFVTGGLVPLSKIKALLTNDSIRVVQIPSESTGEAKTTVSLQMLGPHANAVSASHCQEGQGDKIYSLKKMKVPSATIGGTRKRRKIRTKRTKRRLIQRTKRRTKRRTNKNKSLNRIPKKTIKRNK